MYESHKEKYPDFDNNIRAACMNTTMRKMNYMKNNLKKRKKRSSVIPEEDVNNLTESILNNPTIGGEKLSLLLLENKEGLISGTFCQEAKSELTKLMTDFLFEKKKQAELEKNANTRRPKHRDFRHICPTENHHVWSTDYTELKLFGIKFALAEVYENFSQAYLGVEVNFAASTDIAEKALKKALDFTGGKKPEIFLSDNGGQFTGEKFQKLLDKCKLRHKTTPPGEPWYNGALESGNTNLKKIIYTEAAFAASSQAEITTLGVDSEQVLKFLRECVKDAVKAINEKIPRLKFGTTPINILNGKQKIKAEERFVYKKLKIEERQRQKQKTGGTFKEKIQKAFSKITKQFSDEKLFAIGELLNHRVQFLKI